MHIPDQTSRGHISPTWTYLVVGVGLLLLTAVTVGASYLDLGNIAYNVLVALVIATAKAGLVLLFFMHLKHETPLVWTFGILYPLLLFSLLTGMIVLDMFNRTLPSP